MAVVQPFCADATLENVVDMEPAFQNPETEWINDPSHSHGIEASMTVDEDISVKQRCCVCILNLTDLVSCAY